MKTLDGRIAQFFRIADRYWLHFRLFQSQANRDALAWDQFRRHGMRTSAEGDAGRHRRNLHSARKAMVKIGRAIVPDLQAAGTDCSDLLAFLVTADVGGGGAESARPLWPRVKAKLELATIWPLKPEVDAAHSDDFRSVNWFGETYSFSPNQAPCVQVLWDHWRRGLEVGGGLLLEAAESAGDKPADIFKRHPAWGSMIVSGKAKGTYRLKKPDG